MVSNTVSLQTWSVYTGRIQTWSVTQAANRPGQKHRQRTDLVSNTGRLQTWSVTQTVYRPGHRTEAVYRPGQLIDLK